MIVVVYSVKSSSLLSSLKSLEVVLLTLFLICSLRTSGQEPSFNHYLSTANTLNPAITGIYSGKYQFQGNFKNQWSQIMHPYVTGIIDAQMHILDDVIGSNDLVSIAAVGLVDKSNDGGFRRSQVGGTISFHKALDPEGVHRLGAGFQLMYNNYTLDYDRLTFQSQFRPFVGYDQSISSGEGAGFTDGAFDFSSGFMYSFITDDVTAFIGGSGYHLNMTPISTQYSNFAIPRRWVVHGSLSFPAFEDDRIYGSFSHQWSTVTNMTTLGIVYGKNLNGFYDNEADEFLVGGFLRFNDSFSPYVGYRKQALTVGISYDFTTSYLRKASNLTGSLELGIRYKIFDSHYKEQQKKVKCDFLIW
jgi:type IX secretion system PorP/SprF family membrane protein